MRPHREVSGAMCPRQRGRNRAEISAIRTSSHAHIASLATTSALLHVYLPGFGQLCPSARDHEAIREMFANPLLQYLFNTIQFERRQVITVWHSFKSFASTTDPDKFFYMRIPWSDVIVTYRPVDSVTNTGWSSKLMIAPSLTCAAPDD